MIKNLPTRLAQVGKIKIGVKGEERQGKNGAYRIPSKVDYFIITTMEKVDGNFKPDHPLMQKLDPKNGKPRQLRIALPYDNIDLNFFTEYGLYVGKKRLCYGDGETATRITVDKATKKEIKRDQVKCPCKYYDEGKCKMHGILSVILRDNFQLGGVYQFRTTSVNSIINIMSGLRQIQTMTQGILAMIPLIMSLQPQTVMSKDNKQVTIYAVTITADVQEWKELLDHARDIARIRAKSAIDIKMLESKTRAAMIRQAEVEQDEENIDDTDYTPIENENKADEQADINEEFMPETVDSDLPNEFVDDDENNGLPFPNPKPDKRKTVEPETETIDSGNDGTKNQHSLF